MYSAGKKSHYKIITAKFEYTQEYKQLFQENISNTILRSYYLRSLKGRPISSNLWGIFIQTFSGTLRANGWWRFVSVVFTKLLALPSISAFWVRLCMWRQIQWRIWGHLSGGQDHIFPVDTPTPTPVSKGLTYYSEADGNFFKESMWS